MGARNRDATASSFALSPTSPRQGLLPRKLLSIFRAVWGLQICGYFWYHRALSAPRRSAENVVAALARCTQICGTAAAARSCGVAAVIAATCAAVVTMRLVFPGAAALVRAWNLQKAVEVWAVKPTENSAGAWVVKPGKRLAKNPRTASPVTLLITAPRSPPRRARLPIFKACRVRGYIATVIYL